VTAGQHQAKFETEFHWLKNCTMVPRYRHDVTGISSRDFSRRELFKKKAPEIRTNSTGALIRLKRSEKRCVNFSVTTFRACTRDRRECR
jgi:hypothetical protein